MADVPGNSPAPAAPGWLLRIPAVFEPITAEVLARMGAAAATPLGDGFHLIKIAAPEAIQHSDGAPFASWNLPMEHTWPCNPRRMDRFVEKAAQSLRGKFGGRSPQGIFVGALRPASPDPYFRRLASNLRGRALQLFPALSAATVEEQDPERPTLFGLVGREGLFCGMQSPRRSNGFHPGGSRFIDQDAPEAISRAGAKIAEALHYVRLHRPPPPAGSQWLELGASPGGMTSELLAHGYRVTAVDRAPLDPRLAGRAGLRFLHQDARDFQPPSGEQFDALLCDLNGPAEQSLEQVVRLAPALRPGGLAIFTLKLARVQAVAEPAGRPRATAKRAGAAGLRLLARTHLTCNGHEFTMFFERSAAGTA